MHLPEYINACGCLFPSEDVPEWGLKKNLSKIKTKYVSKSVFDFAA